MRKALEAPVHLRQSVPMLEDDEAQQSLSGPPICLFSVRIFVRDVDKHEGDTNRRGAKLEKIAHSEV